MSMSEDPVQKPSRTEFDPLLTAAREIAEHAYAPYSRFRVGAAALTEDGRLVRGCNVENAGYGVTLCAECGLVSELIAGGGGPCAASSAWAATSTSAATSAPW